MKMKITALLLVLCTLVSLLCGCHGAKEKVEFAVPSAFDTSKDYEITFWAKNDTNISQVKIYEKAIVDFEALYPNIKVTLKKYTDYAKIYNDVITNIATDTTPNVCISYPDHIATYNTGNNVVVPLDNLFDDPKYGFCGSKLLFDSPKKEEIVPKFLSECKIGVNYYAIPFMRSTEACYVNKTYVEKMGFELPETLTWDFVWEVSEAAMKKNDDGTFAVNGQKVMKPFIYKSTDNMMIQYLAQSGAEYSTASGDILLFNDTAKSLLLEVSEHVKNGAFSTFKVDSYPGNFFNAGQCIFAIDSTAGATWIGSDAPLMDISKENIAEFETEVYAIPQVDPAHPKMISQGPSICLFNKEDPQEVLASWLFAQFLLTNGVQNAYASTEGYVPVTLKAQESEEYKNYLAAEGIDKNEHYDVKIKASKLLLANTDNTFVTHVFNGSASVRDAAGQLIENTVLGIRRKQTVDDAFVEKNFNDVYSMYRLDNVGGNVGKVELGPLPSTSKWLLGCLGAAWVLIGGFYLWTVLKKKKETKIEE